MTLSGITIGEPIPDEAFAVSIPSGVEVKEVDELSTLELFASLLEWAGDVWREASHDSKKR